MSEPVPTPPETGSPRVDAELAALAGLDQVELGQHHDRLAAAQDVLNQVLEDSRRPEATVPQGLRPQDRPHG